MVGRKITQYELNGTPVYTYNSINDAAQTMGVNESTIRAAVKYGRQSCGYLWRAEEEAKPKILFIDIETAPNKAYVWKLWKENICTEQLIDAWFMLAFCAKWNDASNFITAVLSTEEVLREDDSRIIQRLQALLDKADVVVSYNGDKFDLRHINTRIVKYGISKPAQYKSVDLIKTARRKFAFPGNSLNALANYFNIDGKIHVDFSLWKRCMEGDASALSELAIYNKRDVLILEKLYYILRPYVVGHHNTGLYENYDTEYVCPYCGSTQVTSITDKQYTTAAYAYAMFRCQSCGAISRSRNNSSGRKVKLLPL